MANVSLYKFSPCLWRVILCLRFSVSESKVLSANDCHCWVFFLFFIRLFFFFFKTCSILKVFIKFVMALLLFYALVFWPQGMWDLSCPINDQTCTTCIRRRSLNHWTTREVPPLVFNISSVTTCQAYSSICFNPHKNCAVKFFSSYWSSER